MRRIFPAVVASVLAAGCGKPVQIGAIVSRSGAAAVYGDQIVRGYDLATEELNARGGVRGRRLQLLYRDDSTNPEMGIAALRDLVERERVAVVLGAVSSRVTLRLASYCERRRIVLISPSASTPQLSDAGDYIFRTYPSDVLEGASMADFARDLGLDRVAILAVDSEYGSSLADVFAERFRAAGGSVVAVLTFPEGNDQALREAVQALAELRPRGLYIPAYAADLGSALSLLRETSAHPIVLGASSVTMEAMRVAGPAAENLVFPMSSFDPDADDPGVRAFAASYRQRYGADPDVYAAHAYDAVRVLAMAVERAGSWEPDDVKDALLGINDYEGATGRMAFDRKGDVIQYPRLYVARGGQFVAYDRFVESGGALPVPER